MSDGFTNMNERRAATAAARQEYLERKERERLTGIPEPGESARILGERALAAQGSAYVPEQPPISPSLRILAERALGRPLQQGSTPGAGGDEQQ